MGAKNTQELKARSLGELLKHIQIANEFTRYFFDFQPNKTGA